MELARKHVSFGWWSMIAFLLLGLTLETLHAFKVSWYLDVGVEARRLMWTLAHAHGVLAGLVNIAFGLTVGRWPGGVNWHRKASPCLLSAGILLPGGFFLGGLTVHGGDPGPGVLVVPVGAVLLIAGAVFAALGLRAPSGE